MKKMVVLRRSSQTFFLVFFIYILWSTTYPLTGIVLPDILFKLDPFIMIMVSVSERILLPGLAIALIPVLLTLIFGRFFCGWVCPLGTAIDMAGAVKKRHAILPDKINASLRRSKFYFLGTFFLLALAGTQAAWIFDPLVIAARFVSMNMIPALTQLFNALFIFLIKYCNLQGAVKDFYYAMKPTVLGVKVFYFAHSLTILVFFIIICAASLMASRLWCRILCPLGALYSIIGRISRLRRKIDDCSTCGRCRNACRMGAIKEDLSYVQGECILCMDCIYDCQDRAVRFKFTSPDRVDSSGPGKAGQDIGNLSKMSRKSFMYLGLSSFFGIGAAFKGKSNPAAAAVIRPPAALEEDDFLDRCIRCGNCMKVCITNGLQPVMFQAGLDGIWTPQLVSATGYCEYRCTLCGHACPTGAIPALDQEQKMKVKLGLAVIDKKICLPIAEGKECLVCEEHCPVSDKAIKLDTYTGLPAKPYIDEKLCVGCGICENKCPTRPVRAVVIIPKNEERTPVSGKRA